MPLSQRFITFHHWMLKSPAFQYLPGNAVKLLVVLAARYTGYNNGEVVLSLREAAREVGCSQNHATKLFRLLISVGFIHVTQRGYFSLKTRHASTYKLNWLPMRRADDPRLMHEETKEFMSWRPDTDTANNSLQKQNTVAHCKADSRTA